MLQAMTGLTPLETALIPSAVGLIGVALGVGGNWLLGARHDKRTAVAERHRAVSRVGTATIDLLQGAQTLRNLYVPGAQRRNMLRVGAVTIAGLSAVVMQQPDRTPRELMDWRWSAPLFDRLVQLLSEQSVERRLLATDLLSMLTSRSTRFYGAVSDPVVRNRAELEDTLDELVHSVGEVASSMGDTRRFEAAHEKVDAALSAFRKAARAI
jgi:hypothetical protein